MGLIIDLDDVRASDRARHWSDSIRSEYLDLDIRFARDRFPCGKMVRSQAGSITMTAAASVAQSHERTSAMARADNVDCVFGVMFLQGSAHVAHQGREVDIRPGQYVLINAADTYRVDILEDYQMLFMSIPPTCFRDVWQHRAEFLNVCIDERQGSTILVEYFRRMAQCFNELSEEQRACMSALGTQLLVDMVVRDAGVGEQEPLPLKSMAHWLDRTSRADQCPIDEFGRQERILRKVEQSVRSERARQPRPLR